MNIREAISWGKSQLVESDSAALDAEVLLLHVLDKTRSHLFAWPDKVLSEQQLALFKQLISKRQAGTPVAHITGYKEFWSLPFKVSPDTLIPRPDTELLVELALAKLEGLQEPLILDLGTGTGAIAIAIASERPDARVIAVDRVAAAVDLAKENVALNQVDNVEVLLSNWFDGITEQRGFDLIVSNPPYIEANDPHLSQSDVRFEPLSALVADNAGLSDIETIVNKSRKYLLPGSYLMLEHGYRQALAVTDIFRRLNYLEIESVKDLGGNDRVTLAKLTGVRR